MRIANISIVVIIILIFISGCVSMTEETVGNVKFPQPSTDFHPKKEYKTTFENIWKIVKSVLETERINIVTSDKEEGRIVTDYVQGEMKQERVLFMRMPPRTTRYKYAIYIEKTQQGVVKLNIICTYEMKSAGDLVSSSEASKDTPRVVAQLENWLYERIEKSL